MARDMNIQKNQIAITINLFSCLNKIIIEARQGTNKVSITVHIKI
ncbi:hypothetical protein [Aminipila sp.]|nr:hypothetical protein [Aminipila sp.]